MDPIHVQLCPSLCSLLTCVAGWSAGDRGRRVLVSEGNRQNAGGETAGAAHRASQVPEAGLPREGQLRRSALRRARRLRMRPVAAEEHGSAQRECRCAVPGVVVGLHQNHLERRLDNKIR